MRVEEVMTTQVQVCRSEDTLHEAAKLMWEHNCGCLPVVDAQSHILGMVTDRDICMGGYFNDMPMSAIMVDTVMAHQTVTCRADDDLDQALQLLARHQIHRLPVVKESGEVIGILSLNDAADATLNKSGVSPKRFTETVVAICSHSAPRVAAMV